jgi:hypothetical protein
MATPLYSVPVSPSICPYFFNATTSRNFMQPTPMSFAASCFKYWRGDLVFRFDVVCSAFHRGKLAVIFEPNIAQYGLITASFALNKQYMKIVDIQETQTFEVCVNWASYRPWLKVWPAATAYTLTTSARALDAGYFNGFISVVPFTTLQSPDNSDIYINCYVYAKDMHFNGLSDANLPSSRRMFTQSGTLDETPDEEDLYITTCGHPGLVDIHTPRGTWIERHCISCGRMLPYSNVRPLNKIFLQTESGSMSQTCITTLPISCIDLNESSGDTKTICQEFFGEEPLSFRAILKRYMKYYQIATIADESPCMLIDMQILPLANFPYGNLTWPQSELFSYLRYAYVGVRGGLRYKIYPTRNFYAVGSPAFIHLLNPSTSFATPAASVATTVGCRTSGSTLYVPSTNGGLEAELPYYTNNLFSIAFKDDYTINDGDFMDTDWFRNFRYNAVTLAGVTAGYICYDIAAGEDFTFLRFQGVPFYAEN